MSGFLDQIPSFNKVPNHVALIMDGNGRWAQSKNHSRFWGHVRGTHRAQEIVEISAQLKIKFLTLFAFSTENWKRPQREVEFLIKLLESHIKKKKRSLLEQNIKVKVVGDLSAFPDSLQKEMELIQDLSANSTGMTVIFALNYGGKQEILKASYKAYLECQENQKTSLQSFKACFERNLEFYQIPDPDLIIRTSGEKRLSNFMLWSSAYSEFYFTKKPWPDFSKNDFITALTDYSNRKRRYGALLPESSI